MRRFLYNDAVYNVLLAAAAGADDALYWADTHVQLLQSDAPSVLGDVRRTLSSHWSCSCTAVAK